MHAYALYKWVIFMVLNHVRWINGPQSVQLTAGVEGARSKANLILNVGGEAMDQIMLVFIMIIIIGIIKINTYYTDIQWYAYMCINIYIYIHVTCIYIYIYLFIHVTYVYIYIHTLHMYIYTLHIYIYIYCL